MRSGTHQFDVILICDIIAILMNYVKLMLLYVDMA